MNEGEHAKASVNCDEAAIALALTRAKARVGRTLPPIHFEIERADLRRYAKACGETWPGYLNGDEAPPTFISSLQTEGMAGNLWERDVPFVSMLHSDDTVELHASIRPGDRLTATARYCDAVLKQGRRGPMLFQTAEMLLHDPSGNLVGRVASSLVSF
jgi:3-methylfumaryl-CoA hydratase